MHLRHLSLADFRSYPSAELALAPGVTTLVGSNGQGKTNLVEAAGYLATLGSHRVANDQPLVRFGCESAVVRGAVVHAGRDTMIEVEITPGRANRGRINRAAVTRTRDLLGHLRMVLFAPEDLALVKGEPEQRRRFLDDLLVARQPRWAGVRADYDKAIRQRNALLRSAAPLWRSRNGRSGGQRRRAPVSLPPGQDVATALESADSTLSVWDEHVAEVGAALIYARLRLLRDLTGHLTEAYRQISANTTVVSAWYRSSLSEEFASSIAAGNVPEQEELRQAILTSMGQVRSQEQERGVSLVGPHRDDLVLTLGEMPAKGYASHGESWSLALSLRLAAFALLRHDLGTDPVLVLDDVFAELDSGRRDRLAQRLSDAEQVLITAAVESDVPELLRQQGAMVAVRTGEVGSTLEAGGLPDVGAAPESGVGQGDG